MAKINEMFKAKWEERKREQARSKKLEDEIYERKKYEYEMKRAETKAEDRINKAEFRATGGYGGAIKRGAVKGFKSASKSAYEGVKRGIKNQSQKPRNDNGAFMGNLGAYDIFGGSQAPKRRTQTRRSPRRSKTRRKKSSSRKRKQNNPFDIFS